jgi:hypothetical protein
LSSEVPMPSDDPQFRRPQIEIVFSLGGGELHVPHDRFPDEWDGPEGITYWYLGAPNYAEDLRGAERTTCPACTGHQDHDDGECPECDGAGTVTMEMRTAIQD